VPVSSSAHVALASRGALAPAAQKALEVALHAGSAPALLWLLRADAARALRLLDRRRLAFHALALAPPAVVGGLLERPIEERLGGPRALAAGLAGGAAALAAADRARGGRAREDAGPADGLALGLAQAAALWPGVSRRGTTLAAARLRGFARAEASALSWEVALPVLVAASALKAVRVAVDGSAVPARSLLAGAAAGGAATVAAAPLLRLVDRGPWWPFAAHRVALAGLALRWSRPLPAPRGLPAPRALRRVRQDALR